MDRSVVVAAILAFLIHSIAAAGPAARDSADAMREEASILRCEDGRRPVAAFGAFLASPRADTRARAALALGRVGRPEAIPILDGLLRDPEPRVRSGAAFALGEIEDSAAAAPLARVLLQGGEDDPHTRALAVEALGKRGVARHAGRVIAALDDPSDEVRESACLASWQIRAGGAVPGLCALAKDSGGELRWKATYALMRILGTPPAGRTTVAGATEIREEDREAIRAILIRGAGERGDVRVRLAAVRGLGRFDDEDSRAAVRSAFADADGRVRVEAIRAAGPSTSLSALAPLLDDPDENVRITAVEALGRIGDPDGAIARLRPLLDPPGRREREVAALALSTRLHARMDEKDVQAGERARAELANLASRLERSDAWRERSLAGTVLDGVPDSSLWGPILRDDSRAALQAVEPWVRTRAAARGAGDSSLATLRPEIARLLMSRDPILRAGVFEALSAWKGDSTAAARLLEAQGLALPDMRPDPPAPVLPVDDYATIVRWAERERQVEIVTDRGAVRLRLFAKDAPLTSWNFVRLADSGFYDRGSWHRVVPDFVVQDGCPRGDGSGGPGYTIRCEINERRFTEGALGMALSGKDTGGSQFFITLSPQPHLDGRYTVFGEVIDGEAVVRRLVQGDRVETVRSLPVEERRR